MSEKVPFRIHQQLLEFMPTNPSEDQLRDSIKATGGVFDSHSAAVVIWRAPDGERYLLDGHSRYRACIGLGLPFKPRYVVVDLPDLQSAFRWMQVNQDARRQLTDDQRAARDVLAGLVPENFAKGISAKEVLASDRDLLVQVFRGQRTLQSALRQVRPKAASPRARVSSPAPPPDPDASRVHQELKQYKQAHADVLKELEGYKTAFRNITTEHAVQTKPIIAWEKKSGLREGTTVALLSDVHAEETVRPGETPIANEYGLEISEVSLKRFFSGYRHLINAQRESFRIRNAVLWLGGDFLTGHLHPENVVNTEATPTEMGIWLEARLKAGIEFMLEDPELELLTVPCSYGNHGRTTAKPYRALGAKYNIEWGIYQRLRHYFANEPRVEILSDESAHQYVRVYDWDLHFHHGDEVHYQGGVGGITIPLNKAVSSWDRARRCHYHNFGHWHQYIDTGKIAVNGSVIGYSAYSMSIKAEPEEPQQAFYVIDSKRGKCVRAPIWVRDHLTIPTK